MEKAREFLQKITTSKEADQVSRLTFPPHRPLVDRSFYESFAVRGVRITLVQPGFISCSLKVPPRLTDADGNLATSAIGNIVDLLGAAVVYDGHSTNMSADMSISYISAAKLNDELEITSRCLGQQEKYSVTHVLMRNKTTGEVVAEGRHSLFSTGTSKL